jgi:signal transduction histidine kinase
MVEVANSLERSGRRERQTVEALTKGTASAAARTVSFMDRLGEADCRALKTRAREEWYAAGAVICNEGDPGDALYVIEGGQVAVLKESADGRLTLLALRGPGEILGEMSLVGQQPRSASLVAVENTYLLRIEAADFPVLMDRHPGISWAVLNVLNDRLQAADIARTAIVREGQNLAQRLQRVTTETERLVELARVRQETIELVVHDLRTPMAVIEGCLQMLRVSLPQEALDSAEEILALAERSTGRLLSLLGKLLTAARQEDPGLSMARQPVNLARLLRSAVDSVRSMAEGFEIELTVELPSGLPRPLGDTAQLERVLSNLLDNALSFTPAGGSIVVAASQTGAEIEVSVTDTGAGIPPQHREHVFERFAQVPGSKGRRRGFGLGLYSCRQMVQAHGGRIWVEPGPGDVGSRFAFTLPLEIENGTDRD